MSVNIRSRLPLILLSLVLIAFIAYLLMPVENSARERRSRVVSVKTVPVVNGTFSDEVEALGTAKANEDVVITAQYTDIVESIHFNDGDRVKKGQVLVELMKRQEIAKVEELQASLTELQSQLDRYEALVLKSVTAISVLEEHRAKTKSLQAQLRSAQAVLSHLTIRAPFDGQLGFRQVSVGALVSNGDVITSLDDIDIIKVDFSVPERFLPTLRVGQEISARSIAYEEHPFMGEITSISSRVDAATRTVLIRAKIDNKQHKLRPGMLMAVNIVRNTDNALQLPENAVIPFEDRHFVFAIENNIAQRKYIEVGRRMPGIVEVLSGLEAGEKIVTEGALKLREGAKVKVQGEQVEQQQ
ncbi:efflux RND transporter periplasmic adaptor subunit [Psychromonas sp. psych-6C06]|uniref:efflux RND transporter periplasmic adaptor subunit n=1 Tax=Psychromonas sp. psych-6C06 TaxID=2058089 RepID=UPI000C32097F|nr:efflux RND transporter periplasmic adaptor subunit [Psychromonas sp. psych-6C06]PKF61615.1 efflux RND transporter periplasmic adaptor subunit [Psychromonas sp. psych-6C06]